MGLFNLVKPNFYVKGADYKKNNTDKTKKILQEKKTVERFGGEIKYTDDITFSSSNIVNSYNFVLSDEQKQFIFRVKKNFPYNKIEKIIGNFKNLNVLVIGELIFDRYCFGSIIGKSGKEPHLVHEESFIEYYLGGSGAIARHLSTFVKKINIISPFGFENFYKKIIKKNFTKNVNSLFLKPYLKFRTITKSRFVDKVSNYKLFGSYILPGKNSLEFENNIIKLIKKFSKKSDLIIVSDYGHKFISKKIANQIKKTNKYISVNAQVNASNIRFHNIDKYYRVNSIIINEGELRQELRDNETDIKILSKKLVKKNKIKNLIITRGINGAMLVNHKMQVFLCPAFATKSIDKVGAGDAMFAIVSAGLRLNLDPELILFIGSIAASISVESIGNKEHITSSKLDRIIEYILK